MQGSFFLRIAGCLIAISARDPVKNTHLPASLFRTVSVSAIALASLVGCTSYTENGELVRHHFGYVAITTPASVSGPHPLQALEVETVGAWIDVDRRGQNLNTGSGGGLGYRFDRREFIPTECRVVFRVRNMEQFKAAAELLRINDSHGGNLCIVRDSQHL